MNPPAPKKSRLATARFVLYAALPAALSLLGFLGGWFWIIDLFAHFRVQYALLLLAAAALLCLWRRWKWAAVAAGFGFLNASLVLPLYQGHAAPAAAGAKPLHVANFNAYSGNKERQRAWKFIQETGPDLVVILEFQKAWLAGLQGFAPAYQVLVAEPRDGTLGLALLSKIPVLQAQPVHLDKEVAGFALGPGTWLAAEASFEWEGRKVSFLGIHPPPPLDSNLARIRDTEFLAVGRWVREQGRPAIVAGDFNATPWSYPFRRLLAGSGIVNSQMGYGVEATWCDGCSLLSLFKVPIDHLVHTRELTTVGQRLAPPLGSDHRMLLTDLAWAQ